MKADQAKLIAASDEQTAALNGVMLEWSGHLVRDIEGFDLGAFTRNPGLTFDAVQKAHSLRQLVEQKGVELPYRTRASTIFTAEEPTPSPRTWPTPP